MLAPAAIGFGLAVKTCTAGTWFSVFTVMVVVAIEVWPSAAFATRV
ncbi:MAG: hypothetical protein H6730_24900 [Deltaproteobacteria bacterium]|nr:hypothetical protein [Deltaproteobacteria bacterium]